MSLDEEINNLFSKNLIEANFENTDGRINSIKDEETIIKFLKDKLGDDRIEEPPPRCWYDIKIDGEPIQIKSSSGKTDNWSSAGALLWCLTDMSYDEIGNNPKAPSVHKIIGKKAKTINPDSKPRGMRIILLDKNSGKLSLHRLEGLSHLVPNGNNLPFQVPWKKILSEKPKIRNQKEAYSFVIGKWNESITKRMNQYDVNDCPDWEK